MIGRLMDRYRGYLRLLAEGQLDRNLPAEGRRLGRRSADLLEAFAGFPQFRGGSEGQLAAWLRQILSRNLAQQIRHYKGTQRRDVRLEH